MAITTGAGWRLYVGADEAAALSVADLSANRFLTIIVIGVGAMTLVVFVVYRRVAEPVRRLSLLMRSSKPGQLASVAVGTGAREVTDLAEDFDQLMATVDRELGDRLTSELKALASERNYRSLFESHPRLAVTLFWWLSSQSTILTERLIGLGRRSAQQRVAHFLLELLTRLGGQRPLILSIDDLQWGDVDSAILLSDLICSPNSPVMLFIGCFRSEDLERSPFLSEIRKSIAGSPGSLEHREQGLATSPSALSRSPSVCRMKLSARCRCNTLKGHRRPNVLPQSARKVCPLADSPRRAGERSCARQALPAY